MYALLEFRMHKRTKSLPVPTRRTNIRLIKQRNNSDCAVCCFAMLTGIPYKRVLELIGDCYHPEKGTSSTETALLRLGYKQKRIPIKGMPGAFEVAPVHFKQLFVPYELSSEYFLEQLWGRRALLSVPSLNYKGGSHAILWDGQRVLDPSRKKTYKSLEGMKPTRVFVFNEMLA